MAHPIYNQNLGLIGILAQSAPQEYTDCITFTGETSDFTLSANKDWDGTVEYSTDRTTWTTWNGTAISSSNKKLYLRGSGNTTFYTQKGARFVLSDKAGCSGNLNTLLEYSNPPTVLSKSRCYDSMFYGCANLTTAPELPATMLEGERCYGSMFYGCTSLTTAPALPATTLAAYSYRHMFNGCSSFKVSSTQTGTYQYEWRLPTSGTMLSTGAYWSQYMLKNTGGTFTSDPSINTTYYVENKPV